VNTITCPPFGRQATCEKQCVESAYGATCQQCTPSCEQQEQTEPTFYLYLDVYEKISNDLIKGLLGYGQETEHALA